MHGMSEVAGQGSYAVKGLIENGKDAVMFSWRKGSLKYADCVCIRIGHNKFLYPYYAIKMFVFGIYAMSQYDIFHFHYGHSLFLFGMDLWLLKRLNKIVVMEYHGSEIRWSFYRKKPEFFYQNSLPTFSKRLKRKILRAFKYTDGIILHDYELFKHLPSNEKPIYFVPLRVEIGKFKPQYPSIQCKRPVIVHAPSHELVKGSRYVQIAVTRLKENYDFEFILVRDKTQEEAIQIYSKADIIVDQLFIGSYGVFAIEAMALGKPVICYISEEIRNQFPEELPIVNATVDTIEEKIELLLQNPQLRRDLGEQGRMYAEKYHDYKIITKKLAEIYEGTEKTCSCKEAFEEVRKAKEQC